MQVHGGASGQVQPDDDAGRPHGDRTGPRRVSGTTSPQSGVKSLFSRCLSGDATAAVERTWNK